MDKPVKLFIIIFLAIMCSACVVNIVSCINTQADKYEEQRAWLRDMAGEGP